MGLTHLNDIVLCVYISCSQGENLVLKYFSYKMGLQSSVVSRSRVGNNKARDQTVGRWAF